MLHDVKLVINGESFGGFIRGQVFESIEHAATQFELDYSDTWRGRRKVPPIEAGDRCDVVFDLNGKPVTILSGYVDTTTIEYEADRYQLKASGRSLVCDLVDCSAINKSGRWKNQNLSKIAKDLAAPFGVEIVIDADEGKPFKRFAIQPGEKVIETLARAARLRGLFLMPGDKGSLVLGKAGTKSTETVIRYGLNVLRARREDSWRDRYSDYICKGQHAADDETFGRAAAQLHSKIVDPHIDQRGRYRPLMILPGGQQGRKDLHKRADWESRNRLKRSERLVYWVAGWTNKEGFWKANTLCNVVDEVLHVEHQMLITQVTYQFGATGADGGFVTKLALTHKEAFEQFTPLPIRRRRNRLGKHLFETLLSRPTAAEETQGQSLPDRGAGVPQKE